MTPAAPPTLRVAICGSGNRSRTVWQKHVAEAKGMQLVGVQDVAPESLEKAVAEGHVDAERTYAELEEMLSAAEPDALIVCPVHSAHASAARAGLESGCHVLVEKPLATDLSDAEGLADLAEERGLLLGAVQNWRTKSAGAALRRAIADGTVGEVSHVFFRYLRDRELPHLPDYLFDEPDPLLYAMAIHHFDLFRFALAEDVVSVEGHDALPVWSRYRHPSVLQLWMETESGVVISYAATFSSRNGHLPKESLQVEGERGTLHNESEYFEPPLLLSRRGEDAPIDLTAHVTGAARGEKEQYELADLAILENFRAAIADERPLVSPARENLGTLAVIEAARKALREGGRVEPARYPRPSSWTPG